MMPKPEPDPYSILGVARNATDSEIRDAYRALVANSILTSTRAIP